MKVILIIITNTLADEFEFADKNQIGIDIGKNKCASDPSTDSKQTKDAYLQNDNEDESLSVIEENNKEEDDESRNDNISQGYVTQNAENEYEKLSVDQNLDRTSIEGVFNCRKVGNILKKSEFTNQETIDELTNQRNINSLKRKIGFNSSTGDYDTIVKLESPHKLKSKAWSVIKKQTSENNGQNRDRVFTFGSKDSKESKENIVQNINIPDNSQKNDDNLFKIIKSNDFEFNKEVSSKISKRPDFSHKRTFEDIFTKDEIIEQNIYQGSKVLIQGDNYIKAPCHSLKLNEANQKKVEESNSSKVENKIEKSPNNRVKSKPKISKYVFLFDC